MIAKGNAGLPRNWGLDLPERTEKPRSRGLTEVSDKGLGLNSLADIIHISGQFIDMAKFSIGSAVITGLLEQKIDLYRQSGIQVFFGGTTFEKFYAQGKLDAYVEIHKALGVDLMEVSDGTIAIDPEDKRRVIARLARDFTVLAEVGCKDEAVVYTCGDWTCQIESCLDAGAWKVIVEGRESGTAGIYDGSRSPREELDAIVDRFGLDNLILEAPKAENQIELINRYGANVNLGNIPPAEVLVLESQRRGLRYDTF